MKILVLNAGSSSLKCQLFQAGAVDVAETPLWEAEADWKQLPGPASLKIRNANQPKKEEQINLQSLENTVEHLLTELVEGDHAVIRSFGEIDIAGHRVVHGGSRFRASTYLTAEVREGIRELAPFAPLHNPLALEAIEAADRILGNGAPQAAIFDTSFHSTLPPESYIYPGPRQWLDKGLRRYGFHGISHQYVGQRASELLSPLLGKDPDELRLITCHLGNGASLCALKGGKSVETTMGFTPLEGLMMGSRSGTIDPSLLIYLQKHDGATVDQLDHILNYESGLRGLSGISSDMRQVTAAAESGNSQATQALSVYVYRLAYFISALLPSIGGLDALVFTGGIGENASGIRSGTCKRLAFLGISLDPIENTKPASDRLISSKNAAVPVLVIRTREDLQIARECFKLVNNSQKGK
jgi:acetate kinase